MAGVAGLAGVVLSWMSCTCAGVETGEEADFDYETGGEEEDERMWIHTHVKQDR